MNLYIPEIGDELRLLEDWRFNLHCETRNESLGSLTGHFSYSSCGWVERSAVPEYPSGPEEGVLAYPEQSDFKNIFGSINYQAWTSACERVRAASPEWALYLSQIAEWNAKCKANVKPTLSVTIPAGSILTVDRIYIRKGLSDWSSITFRTKSLGETQVANRWNRAGSKRKTASIRFWAKLEDCNRIQFERA